MIGLLLSCGIPECNLESEIIVLIHKFLQFLMKNNLRIRSIPLNFVIEKTESFYNSNLLITNLILLNRTYPFLNIQAVGTSVLGRNLYVIKLGRGSKKIFYSASIHR